METTPNTALKNRKLTTGASLDANLKPNQMSVDALIETGIPCSRVIFQSEITSPVTREPDRAYYDPTWGVNKTHRKALIYLTPHFVILVQGENKEVIPTANVKQATPK